MDSAEGISHTGFHAGSLSASDETRAAAEAARRRVRITSDEGGASVVSAAEPEQTTGPPSRTIRLVIGDIADRLEKRLPTDLHTALRVVTMPIQSQGVITRAGVSPDEHPRRTGLVLARHTAAVLTDLRRTVTHSRPGDPDPARRTATRAGALAAHSAELRRIERDLHDGTQARLESLCMRIRLAQSAYDHDPQVAHRLLEDAQEQAQEALAELRHVVRGIHPPILTDRGLVGAVRALAAGSGLGVTTRVEGLADPPEAGPRVPAAVEAAAYFVVAETLTNAAKHSGCRRASVRLERVGTRLRVVVRDDGRGGADEAVGTGLLGIRRRVAALAGTATVSSPVGGPTVIEVELPCVW